MCLPQAPEKVGGQKSIYEEKSYQFVDDLIRDTILLKQGAINVPPLQRPLLPANIAPTSRGNKEAIIERHMSRFH